MIEKTYIIAGNYQQFILYLKDKCNQVCVQDTYRLYGLRKPKVVLIGTYYERGDWLELKKLLMAIEANIIYQ